MMQLLCNGVRLDLYDDASMQFTHENPLFAFDSLKCERTTQFKLPSTPTNDGVFALARIPAYKGDGMRRKFSAQLIDGVVKKNGYLYLSQYDGKDYAAIFVTGELTGLQTLKDAGKIRDIIGPTETTLYGEFLNAGQNNSAWWKGLQYHQERTYNLTKYPSIQLQRTIQECCTALGVQVTFPAGSDVYRILPSAIAPYEKKDVLFKSIVKVPASASDRANTIVDWHKAFEPCLIPIYDIYGEVVYVDDPETQVHGYGFHYEPAGAPVCYVQGWRARMKADVTIGADVAYRLGTLYRWDGSWRNAIYDFYLDGVCRLNVWGYKNQYGAGQASNFEVQAGDEFCFLDYDDVQVLKTDPTQAEEGQTFKVAQIAHDGQRYDAYGQPSYAFYAQGVVTGYKDQDNDGAYLPYVEGDYVDLYSNLPDCTIIELLKALAYMTGTALNYSEADGITFEPLDFAQWGTMELTTAEQQTTIERTFAKYAQANTIRFDSDETLFEIEHIVCTYRIDNDNISPESELAKLYASEGSIYYDNNQPTDLLYLRNEDKDISKDTLCAARAADEYLSRVSLPVNAGLQALCTASTQVTISARMSLLVYTQIGANTKILYRGTEYAWTDRSWQKGTAKFTLAKIA